MENRHRQLVPGYDFQTTCYPVGRIEYQLQPRPNTQLALLIGLIARQVAERVEEQVAERISHAAPIQPVLLSVKDAAVYLGRSEQSIQHLIFARELPVVRVGRRVHLDRRDLDLWIEKNKY